MLITHDALENAFNDYGPESEDDLCPCCGGWGDHAADCANAPPSEGLIDALCEALAAEAG